MQTREEILNEINKILVEENAKAIKEDDLLISSELDSFGYMMLYINIESIYKFSFENDYLNSIDYKKYKMSELIDKVETNVQL